MIDRLGNVLYWAACLLAVVAIVFGGWAFAVGILNPVGLVMFVGGGIVIWLIGRAIRYVLSGR